MSYVPLERIQDKSGGSIYRLVMLVAKRASELADSSQSTATKVNLNMKLTTIALQELEAGKIRAAPQSNYHE